jgi:hypothetical protein
VPGEVHFIILIGKLIYSLMFWTVWKFRTKSVAHGWALHVGKFIPGTPSLKIIQMPEPLLARYFTNEWLLFVHSLISCWLICLFVCQHSDGKTVLN